MRAKAGTCMLLRGPVVACDFASIDSTILDHFKGLGAWCGQGWQKCHSWMHQPSARDSPKNQHKFLCTGEFFLYGTDTAVRSMGPSLMGSQISIK